VKNEEVYNVETMKWNWNWRNRKKYEIWREIINNINENNVEKKKKRKVKIINEEEEMK